MTFRLVYPMFAMVVLTFGVMLTLFVRRIRAVREGKVKVGYFKIYQGEVEPEQAAKAARHFANLFEAPVLFYAACLAAMAAHATSVTLEAISWTYVAARVIHAAVHLGRNRLRPRMVAYFGGWLALLALWLGVVVAVARGG